jgi:hypothetical protein
LTRGCRSAKTIYLFSKRSHRSNRASASFNEDLVAFRTALAEVKDDKGPPYPQCSLAGGERTATRTCLHHDERATQPENQ